MKQLIVRNPEPLTTSYNEDYDSLRQSIDKHLRALAYFNPKIVIRKHKFTNVWIMLVYKRSEWEAWLLFKKGLYSNVGNV